MRIEYTPLPNEHNPIKYWLDAEENTLIVGTNNDDGYRFILTNESMDWVLGYLRNKSALMIPQIVHALISNTGSFRQAKAELMRL